MSRKKNEEYPVPPHEIRPDGSVALIDPVSGGEPVADIPIAAPARKPKKPAARTDRSYWVIGRAPGSTAGERVMVAPTIGQARKRLALVREMPAYEAYELWIERCVRVG